MSVGKHFVKYRHRYVAFLHDLIAIPVAWFLAYWLRFNLSTIPTQILKQALLLLPILLIGQGIAFFIFGLYRGIWRFASVSDLLRIIKAVATGTGFMILVAVYFYSLQHVPRSVFPLYALLLITILGGSRLVYRWLKHNFYRFSDAKRVLIVGAGHAGEGLVRDLLRETSHQYIPVAVVDDDLQKIGREIHGIRVVGSIDKIAKAVKKYHVDLIFLALPSASSMKMRTIVESCEKTGLPFRTLPSLKDLATGKVSINALRAVSLEDLLGREVVSLNWQAISEGLQGKTILVTGGGGSIGSELCRQIVKLKPGVLIILENSEFNLYAIDLELRNKFPWLILHTFLIDVTDEVAVDKIFTEFVPEIVFHAAAYKHVPILESQIRTAIQNNILGTWTLAKIAVAHRVKNFTLISTDKAVNPTNIMGASKRAAEVLCQNFSTQSDTHFVTVRFGNVLGSAGSVVPLFSKQIIEGGPVTVTHPEITRFFMTIPEASQLILQATMMGKGGEIYVLDMGEPIKIKYLAEQMIQLSGLKVNEDIEIVYTGLRPGEKLYEELFHESEQLVPTKHDKILLAQFRPWDFIKLKEILQQMIIACDNNNENTLQNLLQTLVPEWQITKKLTPGVEKINSEMSAV